MYVFTYTVYIYKTTEGRLRLSQTKTAAEDAGVGVATEALSPELDHFFVVVVPLKAFLAGHVSFFVFFLTHGRVCIRTFVTLLHRPLGLVGPASATEGRFSQFASLLERLPACSLSDGHFQINPEGCRRAGIITRIQYRDFTV